MLENVSRSHDVFHKAKLDFIKLSHKTEDTLKKEKTKLTRQLKRANTRVAIEKDRLIAAEKRFAQKRTAAKKKQVKKIKAMLEKEQKMAMKLRKAIDPLSEKLSQAKNHAITARFFDKGMEKIDLTGHAADDVPCRRPVDEKENHCKDAGPGYGNLRGKGKKDDKQNGP